jgi:hypothetical protein
VSRRSQHPRARRLPVLLPVFIIALAACCRGGCRRGPPPAGPLDGRLALALFPNQTRTVVALDIAKLRASSLAPRLAALAISSPADDQRLDTFRQRTGLDPLRQIDSVTVAFPEEARARGELGIILRASHFDQTRLIAYVRDALQKDGDDLVPAPRGPNLLWAARKDPTLAGFFLDEGTLLIGGGGWAEKMADLATARASARGTTTPASAESDKELLELCQRAAAGHAIWAAAIVPAELRRQLERDPRFAGASGVMRMALGIDLPAGGGPLDSGALAAGASAALVGDGAASVNADGSVFTAAPAGGGLDAVFSADLATPQEAAALADKVVAALRDAKRDPRLLMLGIGPDLDSVASKAEGRTFSVQIKLDEAQVTDLFQRVSALLTLARQGQIPGFGP